ncbi:MAG: NUDIX hydrolase, partial [Paludibacteraceae bacterium]|nr:NUDIX hydrolase [Paludibacteraceae bacterium]
NGHRSTREYIKHLGAVAVVALDDEGRIAIEHQFRYPFGAELLEIPAGKLDYEGEDPLEAAKRELREETGITASDFQYLGGLSIPRARILRKSSICSLPGALNSASANSTMTKASMWR